MKGLSRGSRTQGSGQKVIGTSGFAIAEAQVRFQRLRFRDTEHQRRRSTICDKRNRGNLRRILAKNGLSLRYG